MRQTKKFLSAVLLAALTLAPTSLSASSADSTIGEPSKQRIGVTDKEISIGSCIPLSGLLGQRGEHILSGAKAYFAYINEQGGVNGRTIKLVQCDDFYDPDKAIECYNSCLKDKVFAGAFFLGSPAISKYLRMVEQDKMPMLGIYTGNPAAYEHRPNVFTFRPSYTEEVHKQLAELWRRGIRRLAIMYQSDAAGAGVRETVNKDLQERGATPVAEASFPRTDVHIEGPLASIKAANPEAVIVVGATGTIQTVKKRYEQKWSIPFLTYDVQRPYFDGTKEGEGLLATHVLPGLDQQLPGVDLYKKLQAKYDPKTPANEPGFEGFLNARIIVDGLKRAGRDLTRTKFIRSLETFRGVDLGLGPNWRVNYSAENHNGLTSKAVYLSIMHDGKYIPLTENDWKTIVKQAKAGTK